MVAARKAAQAATRREYARPAAESEAAHEQPQPRRRHRRRGRGAQLEEPDPGPIGHERQHGHEAEREVDEEQEEDGGHASVASIAARSGEAGWNGSRTAPPCGHRRAARWADAAEGTRRSRPVTAAAAVRLCAQYP